MPESHVTRRRLLTRAGAAGSLAVVGAGAAGSLAVVGAAAATLARRDEAHASDASALALTGTWIGTVTFAGAAPFITLSTFNADGTLTETDQSERQLPLLGSPSHGVWVLRASNTYRIKFIKLLFAPDGTPAGEAVVHGTLTLSADANSFSLSGVNDSFDAQGHPVGRTPFTAQGRRVMIEP